MVCDVFGVEGGRCLRYGVEGRRSGDKRRKKGEERKKVEGRRKERRETEEGTDLPKDRLEWGLCEHRKERCCVCARGQGVVSENSCGWRRWRGNNGYEKVRQSPCR